MVHDGRYYAIMLAHDVEAFFQGCLMVTGGHSFIQVINEYEVSVMEHLAFFMIRMHQSKSAEKR